MDFALNDIDTVTAAEAGTVLPLTKIDGKTPLLNALKQPVTLTILGSDSKTYRTASRALAKKRVERARATKGEVTDEQLDAAAEDDIQMLADCVTGWDGMLDSKNKPLPFERAGAVELLRRYPVAKEQVDSAIIDRTRFIKASSGA